METEENSNKQNEVQNENEEKEIKKEEETEYDEYEQMILRYKIKKYSKYL